MYMQATDVWMGSEFVGDEHAVLVDVFVYGHATRGYAADLFREYAVVGIDNIAAALRAEGAIGLANRVAQEREALWGACEIVDAASNAVVRVYVRRVSGGYEANITREEEIQGLSHIVDALQRAGAVELVNEVAKLEPLRVARGRAPRSGRRGDVACGLN